MPHLDLHCLGTFEARLNAQPLTNFRSSKSRDLLIYLAIESDRPHPRTALINFLWPDHDESQGRNNLRQALYWLRRILEQGKSDAAHPEPFIIVNHQTLQFNIASDYTLDVHDFLESIEHFQLEKAVSVYRGAFLEGFTFDSDIFERWCQTKQNHFKLRFMNTLSRLTDHYLRHANYEQASIYAHRQLDVEPWSEDAHCQLILALAYGGQHSMALTQYETCRRELQKELGVEPAAETIELIQRIQAGEFDRDAQISHRRTSIIDPQGSKPTLSVRMGTSAQSNVPTIVNPLIGRKAQLHDICQQLQDPTRRLVTIVGAGGVGKTRLALAVAENSKTVFPQGCWFVSLVSVSADQADLYNALAKAVGDMFDLAHGQGEPSMQLFDYLQARELLLILDNFEHVIEGTDFILDLLQSAPRVKLVVTSRERLKIRFDYTIQLKGLSVPSNTHIRNAVGYSSIRLFEERAQDVWSHFQLGDETLPDVIHICQLLDGLPLGIEMAANWVAHYTCLEIAQGLQENLDFLESTQRDLPERHHSLRAVFDYSWNLLTIAEQEVLIQLSVFHGSFSREAAQMVSKAKVVDLASLVDKFLLQIPAVARYDIHPLLHQFITAKSQTAPRLIAMAQERHSTYYLEWLGEHAPKLYGKTSQTTLSTIKRELNNIRQACHWAIQSDNLETFNRQVSALGAVFLLVGLLEEWSLLVEERLEQLVPGWNSETLLQQVSRLESVYPRLLSKLLAEQVRILRYKHEYDRTIETAKLAIARARLVGDQDSEAAAYEMWGAANYYQGDYPQFWAHTEKALEVIRQAGPYHAPIPNRGMPTIEARVVHSLFLQAVVERKDELATLYFIEAMGIYHREGDQWGEARAALAAGHVFYDAGLYTKAIEQFQHSQQLFNAVGTYYMEARSHAKLCHVWVTLGEFAEAEQSAHEALQIADELGIRHLKVYFILQYICRLRYHTGQYQQVITYSQQGLDIATEMNNRKLQSDYWMYKGHALVGLKRFSEALAAYKAALDLRQKENIQALMAESQAALASLYLKQGNLLQAQAYIDMMIANRRDNWLAGLDEPIQVYLTVYQVLQASQDERAPEILTTAYILLQEQAALLESVALKRSFLENVEANRQIIEAKESAQIEDIHRYLPDTYSSPSLCQLK